MTNKTRIVIVFSLMLVFGTIVLFIISIDKSIKKHSPIIFDDRIENIKIHNEDRIERKINGLDENVSDSVQDIILTHIGDEKTSPNGTKKAWTEIIPSSKGTLAEKKELIVAYLKENEIKKFEIPDQQNTVAHFDFLWLDEKTILISAMSFVYISGVNDFSLKGQNFYKIDLISSSIEPFSEIKTTKTRNKFLFFGNFNSSRTAFYSEESTCVDCAPSLAMVRIFSSDFDELGEDYDCWGNDYFGCSDYKWIDENTLEYKIYFPKSRTDINMDSQETKFEIRYLKI